MKLIHLSLLFLLASLGLNYRQLYSTLAIHKESRRLERLAISSADEYQNPEPLEDNFEEKLSPDFWKFSIINGAGKVSHADTWHAAAMTLQDGLNINHIPDLEFPRESGDMTHQPAAERYNNLTLIGGRGYRPTPTSDVVLQFSSRASGNFYGTAGVSFQPLGTLGEDGVFIKPFDMFGFSVAGNESSIQGVNGALCYLALNWMPVKVNALPVDPYSWHDYEIRLHWINKKQWQGILSVDGEKLCEMSMPSFGPVEVHVWSDNSLVLHRPKRWWEIAPSMDLKFQDGGNKEFSVGYIRIFAAAR
ncbi:MAG: hypothetical protein FIB03_15130 [Anaerolineae bacterium]|nr:hypothetical protein [Anaerolineae bacterium]